MGLLEKAQQRKTKETHPQVAEVIPEETQKPVSQSLFKKARLKKQPPQTSSGRPLTKGEGITVVEEHKGYGWNNLGTKRLIFDHTTSDYRYEVIEPILNKKEQTLKNEISILFKMLADINTYAMTKAEKEKFLKETLEQIIHNNNIKFAESKKLSRLSQLKKEEKKQNKEKTPLFRKKKEKKTEDIDTSMFTDQSKDNIFYHLFRDFLGYGKIDILMQDDGIEEVSCDGSETPIFIHHRKYEAIKTNIYFNGEEELTSFVSRLCQISGKQISVYAPIVDGTLPDSSRLQVTLARTVTKGSTFTIRKFREDPITPVDLIGYKTMSLDMAAYFWMVIEHGASILFCGGTASGKTSALNALSLFIPASYKIISIEDTREVRLPHENWIAGITRTGFGALDEQKTGKDIDMFDLIRAALRQRPRVIIVGEVRGREAYSLFQAMATGHISYATVHASTIYTLIQRLENPPISLPRALLTSLEIIVFQNAVEIGGKMVRRMISVTEIVKLDPDTNQLIFMAPFTWVSKVDDRFESSKTSKVLNTICKQHDWSEEKLEQELENRKIVLEWMVEKNIRSYKEVGSIISEYQKYPDLILKKAKEKLGR